MLSSPDFGLGPTLPGAAPAVRGQRLVEQVKSSRSRPTGRGLTTVHRWTQNPLRLDVGGIQSQNRRIRGEEPDPVAFNPATSRGSRAPSATLVVQCRLVIEHTGHHHEINPTDPRSTTGPRSSRPTEILTHSQTRLRAGGRGCVFSHPWPIVRNRPRFRTFDLMED